MRLRLLEVDVVSMGDWHCEVGCWVFGVEVCQSVVYDGVVVAVRGLYVGMMWCGVVWCV